MVDLAKIYQAGENILTSRQNRALKQQALDPNSPANMLAMQQMDHDRQKFTEDQLLKNTELGFKAASEVANNPVTAKVWIPILQQRGILDPSVKFEGTDLGTIRNTAIKLRDSYGKALQDYQQATRESQLLTPEEYGQQLGIASAEANINANVQRELAQSKEDIKTKSLKAEESRQNKTAYNVFATGMGQVLSALEKTTTGPLIGRLPAVTGSAQSADKAIAAMAPILKSMFRTAGEGAFSDKDQELLLAMIPTREDSKEAIINSALMIDSIVRAKLGSGSPEDYALYEQKIKEYGGSLKPAQQQENVIDWSEF